MSTIELALWSFPVLLLLIFIRVPIGLAMLVFALGRAERHLPEAGHMGGVGRALADQRLASGIRLQPDRFGGDRGEDIVAARPSQQGGQLSGGLAQPPLGPVADHGSTDLARGGKAQADGVVAVGAGDDFAAGTGGQHHQLGVTLLNLADHGVNCNKHTPWTHDCLNGCHRLGTWAHPICT